MKSLINPTDSLEAIYSSIPANLYWKNLDGVFMGGNAHLVKSFGLQSIEQITGKTIYDFVPKDIANKITEIEKAIIRHKKSSVVEEILSNQQGELSTYLCRKTPLKDENGEATGLIGIAIDITENKCSEEIVRRAKEGNEFDLDEIINLLPGHIYWKNREHIYLGCNNNMAKLVNLSDRYEYIGKTLYDFAPHEIAKKVTATDEFIMEQGESTSLEEVAFDYEGNLAVYFSHKVPIRNKLGKVIGLAGISIDITEQKQYEHALKEAKEKAESMSRMKSDFIRNISHDLRTPFSGILGLSRFLFEKEEDPQKKETLKEIVESSKNLLALINQIMSSTILENKSKMLDTHLKIEKLIQDIFVIMSPEAKHKNLGYKLNIKSNMPTDIIGDEFGVKRVLLNLIGNAIKFTNRGSIQILAEIVKSDKEQIDIQFTVEDTGIGIPDDKLDVIFEQYSRLGPKEKYQGSGLGLWLVKQLLTQMDGEIYVESELDKGSRFIFTIPFKLASHLRQ